MSEAYYSITQLIERLHRRYLDVLRSELNKDGVKDINPVQCLLLMNIGDEEINVRNLMDRGYYQGSNASYNIKKLVENDYIVQRRSDHDRRSTIIKVPEKGMALCNRIRDFQSKHAEVIQSEQSGRTVDLEAAATALRELERTWTDYLRFHLY